MSDSQSRYAVRDTRREPGANSLGADAVAAGGLVFLSGRTARGRAASSDLGPAQSYFHVPVKSQLDSIYTSIIRTLDAASLELHDLVRMEAVVTARDHIAGYRAQRAKYLGSHRTTSVAVHGSRFSFPECLIQLTPIAAVPGVLGRAEVIESSSMSVHASRTYAKGLKVGDWLFVSGATASAHSIPTRDPHGLVDEASVDDNYWGESAVRLQAEYVVLTKLQGVLQSAGYGLEDIVSAQVYLLDCASDLGYFWETWNELFNDNPPVTSVVPVDGLGVRAARVEISAVAYRSGAKGGVEAIPADHTTSTLPQCPAAVRAGGIVWCSSVAAVEPPEQDEASAGARPAAAEVSAALLKLKRILAASGVGFEDLLRISLYCNDISAYTLLVDALRRHLDGDLPALSAVEVRHPLYSPDTSLCIDAVAAVR